MKLLPLLIVCLSIILSPAGLAAQSRDDRTAEAAARDSYNFRIILEGRVLVSVEGGIATLTGKAWDRDLCALATDTLRAIPDVSVVNNLVLLDISIPEYSDAWTVLQIRQRLQMRAGVNVDRIQIKVGNQVATLEGVVGSDEQKQLAGKYTGDMAAIRSVKNELSVEARMLAGASPDQTVDDASVSTLLKYALSSERLLTASQTKITATNGAVLITGSAESDVEKERVSALAATIRGVKSVRNNVVVKK